MIAKQTKFKQSEIGEIPEGWKVDNLGSIAIFQNGKSSPNRDTQPDYSVYGSNGIIGYTDQINANAGTIVIGRVGAYCGSLYYSQHPCWVTDNAIKGIPKSNIDPKYLFYLLGTLNLNSRSGGSGQPLINQEILTSIDIAVPPYPEQQQITNILSSLDDKVELNRRMNETLEEIGKALFKRWFVDFEFPNEEGKPYKSSGGKMVDSELGEIPEGWKIKTLRELVEYYIGGGWGSELQDEDHPIEAAVVRGTDIPAIKTGSYDSLPVRFHKITNYKSRVLNEGDIVFEVSGGSIDQPVGRSCLVLGGLLNQYSNKPICASFCKLIRPVKNLGYLLQPSFELLYSTDEIYKYQEKSTGITNYKFEFFLDDYKFAFPSDQSLITQYISFSRSLNNRISALSVESEYLKKIRDSFLLRLMSGKLRV